MARHLTAQEAAGAPAQQAAGDGKADLVAKLKQWKKWDEIAPHEKSGHQNIGEEEEIKHGDVTGTKQRVTVTATPLEILTFSPDTAVLWPGEIVSSKSLIADGSLQTVGIPGDKRGSLKIVVDALSAGNSDTVEQPDGAKVHDAVRGLVNGKKNTSPDIRYQQTSAYSSEELCLELGLSAQYGGFSANVETKFSRKEEYNSIVYYLRERAFTATAVWENANELIDDSFTEDDLAELESDGSLGPDDPPVLVSSVSFGRVLMAFISSRVAETEINAAIDASHKAFAGLEAEVREHYQKILRESRISVLSYGGNPDIVGKMLEDGSIAGYFSEAKELQDYSEEAVGRAPVSRSR
ncbi:thiol-activated cytolysin family protein [Kitasatospora sp. NPDC097605]|uniref:thiol-activated cytolysin family protein n=1 Tax=Kitasatospora sp. NPDC097605 TaxID=3157226 RepID=UPI00332FF2D8